MPVPTYCHLFWLFPCLLDADLICSTMLAFHGFSMSFEVGVLMVTVLQLFSSMHENGSEDSTQALQIGLIFISLLTTVLAFALTALGAGSVMAGLRAVVRRISTSGSAASRCKIKASDTEFVEDCVVVPANSK
jgi:hypothetical protein